MVKVVHLVVYLCNKLIVHDFYLVCNIAYAYDSKHEIIIQTINTHYNMALLQFALCILFFIKVHRNGICTIGT